MTLAQLKEIMKASLDSYGEGYFGMDELPENFTEVEDGEWVQDYKYQSSSLIVKDEEGNFFEIVNSRSGSYHTDWNYNTPDIFQVVPVEKTVVTTTWEAVQ